jgi:hypothetical protein
MVRADTDIALAPDDPACTNVSVEVGFVPEPTTSCSVHVSLTGIEPFQILPSIVESGEL